jgi:hypothetical protein
VITPSRFAIWSYHVKHAEGAHHGEADHHPLPDDFSSSISQTDNYPDTFTDTRALHCRGGTSLLIEIRHLRVPTPTGRSLTVTTKALTCASLTSPGSADQLFDPAAQIPKVERLV